MRKGIPAISAVAVLSSVALGVVGAAVLLKPSVSRSATSVSPPVGLYPAVAPKRNPGRSEACLTAPDPLVSLKVGSPHKRGDVTSSIIDPERKAAVNAAVKSLSALSSGVVWRANTYALSGGARVDAAECAGHWLAQWAASGALEDMRTHDAVFHRSIKLGGIAQAYLQIRPALGDAAERRAIEAWLSTLATQTADYYDQLPNGTTVKRNNHRYWAAFAVMSVAAVTQDGRLAAWGTDSYKEGVCSVTPDGALPFELKRGKAARDYHVYALGPLLGVAEMGERRGQHLYDACDGKLHRLVAFTTTTIDSPARIETLTGAPQAIFYRDDGDIKAKNSIAGMEFYERRFPGRMVFSNTFQKQRPYAAVELGGAVTKLLDLASRPPG